MKKITTIIAVLLGVALSSAAAFADDSFYISGVPGMAAMQAIQSGQRNEAQPQRLSPRNRLFLSPIGQPQSYNAATINSYIIGTPNTNYRVMPVVRQPMNNP